MRASDEVGVTHERDEQSMLGRGSYGMTKRWLIRNYLAGGVYYKKELPFSRRTFFEIHTLLGDKLLPRENLGIIRSRIVEIGMSAYAPLDNMYQLGEEYGAVLLMQSPQNHSHLRLLQLLLTFVLFFIIFSRNLE